MESKAHGPHSLSSDHRSLHRPGRQISVCVKTGAESHLGSEFHAPHITQGLLVGTGRVTRDGKRSFREKKKKHCGVRNYQVISNYLNI